jgi:pimeloyl-ACP methyl ester carboxylesterase
VEGWDFLDAGPSDAPTTVLMLPGALCTGLFYSDVLADGQLDGAGVRLVAATPPGFGGNPLPDGFDMSLEGYAGLVEEMAESLGAGAIVGHSYFANVAIEVAARGRFAGPLVLLSPCFSKEDEEKDLQQIARIAGVPGLGPLAFRLGTLTLSSSMKGRFPEDRHDELVAEMKKASPRAALRLIRGYFDHFDRHGSLVARLADSGADASVVRGDEDEIGLTAEEAAGLDAAPNVTVVTIPGAKHFSMTDQPAAVTRVILDAAGAVRPA